MSSANRRPWWKKEEGIRNASTQSRDGTGKGIESNRLEVNRLLAKPGTGSQFECWRPGSVLPVALGSMAVVQQGETGESSEYPVGMKSDFPGQTG